MTEPESVYHQFCPKAETIDHGDVIEATNPLMTLTRKLDDGAGHQRTYVCSKCGVEVSIGFPPSDPVKREDEITSLIADFINHTWCGTCEHSSCGGRCRTCITKIVKSVLAYCWHPKGCGNSQCEFCYGPPVAEPRTGEQK